MKPNSFLVKVNERIKEESRIAQYCNERQCLDALIVSVNEEFGFGKERISRLIDAYIKSRKEIADMFLDDRHINGDKDLNYSKEKMDRTLKQIMGNDYPDFEKRYHFNMNFAMYEGGLTVK